MLPNNGDETFAPETRVGVGDRPQDLTLGDLDGDCDLDMVVPNLNDDDVSVLLNTPKLTACSAADQAEPLGVLDFNDVVSFLIAFSGNDPAADLAPPVGVYDFNDVVTFLSLFAAGCP